MKIAGELKSGLGEGAYYVRKYASRIKENAGFTPFPGTLNLRVSEIPPGLGGAASAVIPEFRDSGRVYGSVKLIPAALSHRKSKIKCHLILPERTHHKNELELISPVNLRKKLVLRDGDEVEVEV